jgi:uncharacterized protein YbbC (DUF1343 family)
VRYFEPVLTGLDRLIAEPSLVPELRSGRVGLLAHPASVTKDYVHALTALRAIGVQPRKLFGPEHGWTGGAQDMIGVGDSEQVISLYGERFEDLSPTPAHLEGLDVILIDLQDVGARYYTFIWTAVLVARACHSAGVRVVILDRPNPIGTQVEGRLQEANYLSFVGLEKIPIRHGLTIGQIVQWRGRVEGWAEMVDVIACRRSAQAVDPPWVLPSPNMPTRDTALVYPGGCLLEGTNLSDGRGTTRPFEITGASWLDGPRFAAELTRTGLPGFVARPLEFEPTFHKHAKKPCGGLQIHVTDAASFRPVATYIALSAVAHHLAPDHFVFRTEKYEYVDHLPAFDILSGSGQARERILRGEDPREIAEWVSAIGPEEREIIAAASA